MSSGAAVAMTMMSVLAQPIAATDRPAVVLLHGAFEDASVWRDVQADLAARGFRSIAVNLPGRPGTELAPDKASLELYRDTVLRVVTAEAGPVVLVGHSFGGMTISAVAEAAPERIRTLVYVAAYLPQSGQALVDLSGQDRDSRVGPHFQIMADRGLASVAEAARGELFCNDCTPAQRAAIPGQMVAEPLAPLAAKVTLTTERFGRVDRVYVHTARDQVVSPALQARMVAASPVRAAVTLDTGHTPFLTDARGLAAAIAGSVR